jgi:hypothetical protein
MDNERGDELDWPANVILIPFYRAYILISSGLDSTSINAFLDEPSQHTVRTRVRMRNGLIQEMCQESGEILVDNSWWVRVWNNLAVIGNVCTVLFSYCEP